MHKKNIYKLKTIFCCLVIIFVILNICLSCKNGTDGINGLDGKDGISIIWLGSYASADEIENPQPMNAYYNNTDGSSYIYDGKKWTLLAKGIPEIKESDKILLTLSLPNDNENCIKLTKDSAPIKVSIPSSFQISKAVWKKGDNNIVVNPSDLIDDTESNPITLDFNNTGSFYVSENGWYDVVAQDSLGRLEWNHIEVKTIDKTPLGEVKQLTASTKDRFATINWKDITSKEKYDSPIKCVKITYVYNDDEDDTSNGELLVDAGVETASITIPRIKTENDFIRIMVQTVDEVGNVSAGTKVQTWCSNQIYATEVNFTERLNSMTTSGEIAVVGECDIRVIREGLKNLADNKPAIKIRLDLSEVTGCTEIPSSAFDHYWNLESIILPEGIKKIGAHAFFECLNLLNVTFPESVTTIENDAFFGCKKLTEVIIPNNITTIESGAFKLCDNIKKVQLPSNLLFIEEEAFMDTPIEEIIIPKTVNRIGMQALNDCNKIIFEDKNTNWYMTDKYYYAEGTSIGPMIEETTHFLIHESGSYKPMKYYYSEKYLIE